MLEHYVPDDPWLPVETSYITSLMRGTPGFGFTSEGLVVHISHDLPVFRSLANKYNRELVLSKMRIKSND